MKKLLSVAFAVMMVMSVSGAAFAAEPQACQEPNCDKKY